MTLLFSEGFSPYASASDLNLYGIVSTGGLTYDATGGYQGAPCFRHDSDNSNSTGGFYYQPYTAPASNELHFGFWLKIVSPAVGTNAAVANETFQFYTSDLNQRCGLRLNGGGSIGWRNVNVGVASGLNYNGTILVNDGQHHWIEGKIIIAPAGGGTVQIWVDGVLDINQTGVTNDSGLGKTAQDFTVIRITHFPFSVTVSQYTWVSHVVIWDASGSVMNGYVGPTTIGTLAINGAGDNSDMTPSAGSNYQCVDEAVMNQDTDYVEDATSGHKDLYNYTSLPSVPNSIIGVNLKCCAKNPDVGTKTFRQIAKNVATTTNGSDKTLTAAYKQFTEFVPVDPNTGAAWTKAGLDSAQFGVEVRT